MNWTKIDGWLAINWQRARIAGLCIGTLVLALLAAGLLNSARAEGIAARPGAPIPVAAVVEATQWTGFGAGVYGSWVGGQLDTGGPINFGAEGSVLGGQLSYSLQAGVFVVEAFADYGVMFGDLKTIGADAEFSAGGKAGILVSPATLVYGLSAKSWIDPEEGDLIDGWQFGGGIAVRLPSAPAVMSLEYRRGLYEIGDSDVSTDTVRAGLTYRFGLK